MFSSKNIDTVCLRLISVLQGSAVPTRNETDLCKTIRLLQDDPWGDWSRLPSTYLMAYVNHCAFEVLQDWDQVDLLIRDPNFRAAWEQTIRGLDPHPFLEPLSTQSGLDWSTISTDDY